MIYGVYIVSKSGGLIFHHDHSVPRIETEKTFSYPLDLKLDFDKKFITVSLFSLFLFFALKIKFSF